MLCGKKIRMKLLEKEILQKEMLADIGMSRQLYGAKLSDMAEFKLREAVAISRHLDCTIEEILKDEYTTKRRDDDEVNKD